MFTSRGLSTAPSAATKLKPDQPHPSWTDYGQLLNNFLEKMVHKERLGFKWWVRPNPSGQQASSDNYHLWFDEEKVRCCRHIMAHFFFFHPSPIFYSREADHQRAIQRNNRVFVF
jgi:hypothetical protein